MSYFAAVYFVCVNSLTAPFVVLFSVIWIYRFADAAKTETMVHSMLCYSLQLLQKWTKHIIIIIIIIILWPLLCFMNCFVICY
jgi:hypothetical protein